MKGKGFDRLRGAAVISAMGLGSLAGGGTARAATASIPLQFSVASGSSPSSRTYVYGSGTANGIGNITDARNPAITTAYQSTTAFAMREAYITGSVGLSDMYDGAFQVAVDGVMYVNPDGDVDLTGNTLTTDVATVSGVDVQVQMEFGIVRPGVLRVMYSFTNTSGSPVTKAIAIGGDLGSDTSSTVQWSANGDTDIDATDAWYISNDNTTVAGDPINDPGFTFARFGSGAAVIPVPTSTPGTADGAGSLDNFVETFDVTIPAGATRRIVLFAEMTTTLDEAKANAASFDSAAAIRSAGMLAGLSQTEQNEVVNFNFGAATPAAYGGGSALGLGSLLTLSGFAGLFRLRRRRTVTKA